MEWDNVEGNMFSHIGTQTSFSSFVPRALLLVTMKVDLTGKKKNMAVMVATVGLMVEFGGKSPRSLQSNPMRFETVQKAPAPAHEILPEG